MMKCYMLVLCFVTWLILTSVSQAATYYVGPAGNNSNSCATAQTEGTPKLTINAGASCLAASDTLIVKSGVYAEIMSNIVPSGTAGNHTIVRSQVQYGAIIRYGSGNQGNLYEGVGAITFVNRNYITFDGFTLDGTGMTRVMHVYFPGVTTNITIQNNDIGYGADNGLMDNSMGMAGGHGSSFHIVKNNIIHDIGTGATTGQGFYAYGMYDYFRDSVIENNEIRNCSGYGMHFYNTVSGDNARNIIRNNRVHNNGIPSGKPGVLIDGGPDNQFYGNLVYANGSGGGIQVGGYGAATSGTLLYNNTIHGNAGSCIKIGSQYGGPSGTLITNNICYGNASNSVTITTGSGTVQTTNLLGPNPLFVNSATANFRLQAGSPAIGTGTNTTINPTDHVGTAYTLPKDMGAYDYTTVVNPLVLVFAMPPMTTVQGVAMPLVRVCADDTAGVRQTSFANNISLALGANPGGSTLTGGTGGAPTLGCRDFTGLSLNNIGNGYTLVGSATGATNCTSGAFNIVASPTVPTLLRLNRVP